MTPLDPGLDLPSTAAEQLRWLEEAGLSAEAVWERRDLAVLVGIAAPPARA